jgi:hypothetical protein
MPSEVSDIKQFIEICRRKDAKCTFCQLQYYSATVRCGARRCSPQLKRRDHWILAWECEERVSKERLYNHIGQC